MRVSSLVGAMVLALAPALQSYAQTPPGAPAASLDRQAPPGSTKRAAVRHALRGPITSACPASILRLHPSCILFLDRDSSDQP